MGSRSRTAIETAARTGSVRFSAVSMLEVTRLYWERRVKLKPAPTLWYQGLLDRRFHEIPVTSQIAMLAGSLKNQYGFHSDPADQIVAATAMVAGRTMVTSDRKTLGWASNRRDIECLDARV